MPPLPPSEIVHRIEGDASGNLARAATIPLLMRPGAPLMGGPSLVDYSLLNNARMPSALTAMPPSSLGVDDRYSSLALQLALARNQNSSMALAEALLRNKPPHQQQQLAPPTHLSPSDQLLLYGARGNGLSGLNSHLMGGLSMLPPGVTPPEEDPRFAILRRAYGENQQH